MAQSQYQMVDSSLVVQAKMFAKEFAPGTNEHAFRQMLAKGSCSAIEGHNSTNKRKITPSHKNSSGAYAIHQLSANVFIITTQQQQQYQRQQYQKEEHKQFQRQANKYTGRFMCRCCM